MYYQKHPFVRAHLFEEVQEVAVFDAHEILQGIQARVHGQVYPGKRASEQASDPVRRDKRLGYC